jgi:hypothetical protein
VAKRATKRTYTLKEIINLRKAKLNKLMLL